MRRVTIVEAARELGVTPEVIRDRIRKHELVACQGLGSGEYVWLRETSVQSTLRVSNGNEQEVAHLQNEIAEMKRLLEDAGILEMKQQVADLQRRVEALERRVEALEGSGATATPMEEVLRFRTTTQEEGAYQPRKNLTK
jgi:hypothetical protein